MALKEELGKAEEAARLAKAAVEQKFYELGVQETEAYLTEELAEVCRDYCQEVWIEALNLARVPVASEWRRVENVYYPSDFREAPITPLSSKVGAAAATTTPEQLPGTHTSLSPSKTSEGPGKAGDQSCRVEGAKGKKVEALPKAKDLKVDPGKEANPKKKESELVQAQAMALEKKASLGKTADLPVS